MIWTYWNTTPKSIKNDITSVSFDGVNFYDTILHQYGLEVIHVWLEKFTHGIPDNIVNWRIENIPRKQLSRLQWKALQLSGTAMSTSFPYLQQSNHVTHGSADAYIAWTSKLSTSKFEILLIWLPKSWDSYIWTTYRFKKSKH